ncbi:response regulator transcription factor [Curtobacterium sp. Leaf261]|uniref:response regulator transcription factor n=1 Tax=Curtobacterium sp. Leaf261 TaxID=1736311 RepID=UPI00071601C1|nr:response regulator transcription factor [Curtobacterium sp. Leaf261]KQO62254.1 hypothetical protein ASF23_10600 [Curtobacterium sp. Leaf261]
MNDPTRGLVHVALVDDHRLFREGLATLLSTVPTMRVVAHAARPSDVLDSPEARAIDVLLLDVELDGPPARTTIAALRRTHPAIAVVILTMHRDAVLQRSLLEAGARDFLTKDTPFQELCARIAAAADPRSSPPSLRSAPPGAARTTLSPREQEVLRLVAAALTNTEIAAELHIAPGTAKRHVFNIFRKLDVSSRIAAVDSARRLGILR